MVCQKHKLPGAEGGEEVLTRREASSTAWPFQVHPHSTDAHKRDTRTPACEGSSFSMSATGCLHAGQISPVCFIWFMDSASSASK
jgi:hypothetical protein